ncbi:Hypothetical predicted protein [Lecanosticta acicola]|uniref:Uncharacterized protein n=1 Tax=Lecanosticta acicola TaxID=111012 RepID=A0AAI9E9E1_9PEZI|nr:Hypothetical predicted protein [Lecanosticta acicola]
MTTLNKRILHFGLPGHPTDPSVSNESIQAIVTSGAEKARKAGYDVQLTFLDPEDFTSSLSNLKSELGTGKWDALVIGGGIRVAPQFVVQFEQTINIAREVAPKTRILFQAAPGDIYETVQRGFEGGI